MLHRWGKWGQATVINKQMLIYHICMNILTNRCWQRNVDTETFRNKCSQTSKFLQANVYKELLQGRRRCGQASLEGFSELLDSTLFQIYQGPAVRLYFALNYTLLRGKLDSIAVSPFTNICEYSWIGRRQWYLWRISKGKILWNIFGNISTFISRFPGRPDTMMTRFKIIYQILTFINI